ncbi:MAG: Uma2 family endonuclease [Acidobacteriota bacterium]|nr:Uma2 family endonuclease [Acidobacteriota bacterium]
MLMEALPNIPTWEPPAGIEPDDLPDMHDLPCNKGPEEPGVPDQFHILQPRLLDDTFKPSGKFFAATDMNLYFDPEVPTRYKRPDWLAAIGAEPLPHGEMRKSYVMWKEKIPPYIVIELLSFGSDVEDLGVKRSTKRQISKWDVYKDYLKVPHYIAFDFEDTTITGNFKLKDGKFVHEPCMDGPWVRIPFPEIGLELRSWVGRYNGVQSAWLRFYDAKGNIILTPEEEAEQQRAAHREECRKNQLLTNENQRLRDLLRSAGIDPGKD